MGSSLSHWMARWQSCCRQNLQKSVLGFSPIHRGCRTHCRGIKGVQGGGCHREASHWWPSPCLLGYYGKSFTGWWYTGGTRLQSSERVTREVAGSGEAYSCIRRVWSWRRHERSWFLGKPCCRCLALEEQPSRRLVRQAPT